MLSEKPVIVSFFIPTQSDRPALVVQGFSVFLSLSLSVCLSLYGSLPFSLSLSLCLSLSLSLCLFLFLSLSLSDSLSLPMSLPLSPSDQTGLGPANKAAFHRKQQSPSLTRDTHTHSTPITCPPHPSLCTAPTQRSVYDTHTPTHTFRDLYMTHTTPHMYTPSSTQDAQHTSYISVLVNRIHNLA